MIYVMDQNMMNGITCTDAGYMVGLYVDHALASKVVWEATRDSGRPLTGNDRNLKFF